MARLADATFLDLWSYPNTFIDKKGRGGGDGKELCDLLVVCGDDVIVFSDKSIAWPNDDNINLAWSRWYRRAVKKSVDQIRGAERWLKDFPERIFVNKACDQRLPLMLPPPERRRVHGVAVALGAQLACSKHFGDLDGSLMVSPGIKGDAHTDAASSGYMPFAFGDVDPGGPFVHVFDQTGLDLVMRELDTVSDFVRYLGERQRAIRGERLLFAPSEADLLALYLQSENERGEHVFPDPSAFGASADHLIQIPPGLYDNFIASTAYSSRRIADRSSYVWDQLIREFTGNLLAGTSVPIAGMTPSIERAATPEPRNPWTEFACRVRRLKDERAALAAGRRAGGASLTRLARQARNQPWDLRAGGILKGCSRGRWQRVAAGIPRLSTGGICVWTVAPRRRCARGSSRMLTAWTTHLPKRS